MKSGTFGLLFLLVLTKMELTFFMADHMVMYFGSVAKTVLITHQCLCIAKECLDDVKFFSLPIPLPFTQTEGGQEAGRGHNWDS